MKLKLSLVTMLFLSVFASSSMAQDSSRQDRDVMVANTDGAPAKPYEQSAPFLSIVQAVNDNEIALGQYVNDTLGNDKDVNSNVKNLVTSYAQKMIREHSDNNKIIDKLSAKLNVKVDLSTGKAKDISEEGQKELDRLKDKKGLELAKAYMDDMVTDHQKVAHALQKLIAEASQSKMPANVKTHVKDHLLNTLKHVKKHLAEAIKIQHEIASDNGQ